MSKITVVATTDPEKRKATNRRYYEAGGAAKIREAKRRHVQRNVEYVKALKENARCTDCKKRYPYYVLDFDHLRDKECNITVLVYRPVGLARLQAEIDKCEIVCANCHRERTHSRASSINGDAPDS